MNTVVILTPVLILVVIVILAFSLTKIDKKETYCVDLNPRGFATCSCNGYCETPI